MRRELLMSSLEPPTSAKVLIETTKGELDIEIWAKEVPNISRTFLENCIDKKYVDNIFGKVIKDYIVQTKSSEPEPNFTMEDEFHSRLRYNRKGLLCALKKDIKRKHGNSVDSFFITIKEMPEFANVYVVFGKVVGDSLYNLMKINDSTLNSKNEPIYPAKIIDTKVTVPYFSNLRVPEQLENQSQLSKKIKTNDKKRRIKMIYEMEDDGTDIPESKAKFKMKSAHELLDDKKLSNNSILNKTNTGIDEINTEKTSVENNSNDSLNTSNNDLIIEKEKEISKNNNELVGSNSSNKRYKMGSNCDVDSEYDSNLDLSDIDIDFIHMKDHKFI